MRMGETFQSWHGSLLRRDMSLSSLKPYIKTLRLARGHS